MIKQLDDRWYEGRYMWYHDFGRVTTKEGTKGKTHVFGVTNKLNHDSLGEIRWYPRFRKYCYFTCGTDSIFDNTCMKEIIEFCEMKTKENINANKEHVKELKEKNRMAAARLRREQAEQEIELKVKQENNPWMDREIFDI